MNMILIDEFNNCYENFIFIGDFNLSAEECQMEDFSKINCLEGLIQMVVFVTKISLNQLVMI